MNLFGSLKDTIHKHSISYFPGVESRPVPKKQEHWRLNWTREDSELSLLK